MLKNPRHWDNVEVELKRFPAGTDLSPKPQSATTLSCFLEGTAEGKLEGHPIHLKQTDCLWVPPGTTVGFTPTTDICYWHVRLRSSLWAHQVDADQEILDAIKQLDQKSLFRHKPFSIREKSFTPLIQVIKRMHRIQNRSGATLAKAALKAKAVDIIRLVIMDPEIGQLPTENVIEARKLEARRRVAPALEIMDRSQLISEEICSIEELSDACHMKSSRFHSLFVEATGTTPIRYLNQKRIDLACVQLSRTKDKVIDIAYSVGYRSPSRFYSAFRLLTGTTPQKWRLKNAEQIDPELQ